jgi:aspartate/methionine/tyrosine aminotransferase
MLRPDRVRRPAATLDGPFISTSSLTKSYGLAGLRSGWAVTSSNTAERLRRTRDVVDNANSVPADLLAALAVSRLPALAERARRLLTTNVARARAFFGEHQELDLAGPIASSIVFPRLVGAADTAPLAETLLERDGVAVVPGELFGCPQHLRIGLGGDPAALEAGLSRLGARLRHEGGSR